MAAGVLNLALGHPSARLLPEAIVRDAFRAVAGRAPCSSGSGAASPSLALSYGARLGCGAFRASLAAWLGGNATAAELLVTNGASHGLDLCVAALARPGDVVLAERASYFLALGVFRDHGLAVRPAESDAGGLCVDALEASLRSGAYGPGQPRLVYVVPTHCNPTGATLSFERRRKLVSLAARYGFFVVADEVYTMLDWSASGPPPRLAVVDKEEAAAGAGARASDDGDDEAAVYSSAAAPAAPEGHALVPKPGATVVSLGSFTKVLSPGLRLGWVEGAPQLVDAVANRGYMVSGGGVAPVTGVIAHQLLETGQQDAHLNLLCETYAARCEALCGALSAEEHRAGWSFTAPTGGYFVWVRLPEDACPKAVAAKAAELEVAYLPGHRCAVDPDDEMPGRHVRLCFAHLEEDGLREAVRRLASAVVEARS